jgi:hypothetical protein
MAVQDLSRHFGVGWQTITSVVGTIAVISLTQDKKLPPQIAVSAAIAISFWAILNILDASFWAIRAIAFLANVEAVYFYESERHIFNPYVGSHPPLKALESLRYQLYAALVMLVLSCAYYLNRISDGTNHFSAFFAQLRSHTYFEVGYWALPGFVFLIMLEIVLTAKYQRIKDYRDFVTNCPGPGLVRDRTIVRGMDLEMELSSTQLQSGPEIQKTVREVLVVREKRWKYVKWGGLITCLTAATLAIILIICKNHLPFC